MKTACVKGTRCAIPAFFNSLSCLPQSLQLLAQSENAVLGHQIANGVLDKIDAILFATDYNALSVVTKTRWIKERYLEWSDYYNTADGYNVNITRQNNNKRKAEYDKWRKTFQYTTTARNRLLILYTFVSGPVPCICTIY